MKKTAIVVTIVMLCFSTLNGQKSKVISLFQLIDGGKYEEAKTAIEEVISEDKSVDWPVTWYTRGLLCQTAYEKGIEKNNKKHYELYPDQLYVAYESYEKALRLDTRGKIEKQLAPLYVMLANDFQKMGEKHFKSSQYKEALRAFEQALEISKSPLLEVKVDTNLLFNTALAAYESKEWEKATTYLTILNENRFAANVSHLLFTVYLEKGDTTSAENLLAADIERYDENEALVLLLTDLLFRTGKIPKAIAVLDTASAHTPTNYVFPYTKGVIYQKTEAYREAITAYEAAVSIAPDEVKIYVNMGTCYYNIGVEIDEKARSISNNRDFQAEKAKSIAEFNSAVKWLEIAHEKDADNKVVIEKLYSLYRVLGVTDKVKKMEAMIE